jgi:hypothetical protein
MNTARLIEYAFFKNNDRLVVCMVLTNSMYGTQRNVQCWSESWVEYHRTRDMVSIMVDPPGF